MKLLVISESGSVYGYIEALPPPRSLIARLAFDNSSSAPGVLYDISTPPFLTKGSVYSERTGSAATAHELQLYQ